MTTRNSGQPLYTDLAKAGAVIKRDISASAFTRLVPLVADLETVTTELSFGLNELGHAWVKGYANARLSVDCQACSEPVTLALTANLDGLLVTSELAAQEVAQRLRDARGTNGLASVIVVSGPELNEVDLIEDELLLQLPSQVCRDETCERRPVMAYGPDEGAQGVGEDTQKPFAILADLWRKEQ